MKSSRRRNSAATTIIKRSGKRVNAAHHGGAWKVAFADFTLAMMALFMVLWIVNSVSPQEREEIVNQLHGQSIFDGNIFSPIDSLGKAHAMGGSHILPGAGKPLTGGDPSSGEPTEMDEVDETAALDGERGETQDGDMKELARIILKVSERHDAGTNLKFEIIPQGLRVLIQDDKSREMFPIGSSKLNPFFNKLLVELSPVFQSIDNSIIITGHTDSLRYKDDTQYNNWHLAGDRAFAARSALVAGGLESNKILQVNSMADRVLLDVNDPKSAQNRRIEIMVLTKKAEDTLYQFFGYEGKNIVKKAAEKISSAE